MHSVTIRQLSATPRTLSKGVNKIEIKFKAAAIDKNFDAELFFIAGNENPDVEVLDKNNDPIKSRKIEISLTTSLKTFTENLSIQINRKPSKSTPFAIVVGRPNPSGKMSSSQFVMAYQ
ncbi:MAG: hypothetical protein AAF990_18565 [Bacteroidota bacterium]